MGMKPVGDDSISIENRTVTEEAVVPTRRPWHRFRELISQFRRDLREPLPGNAERSFGGKVAARFRYLVKRHGWKLVGAIVIYYLIRDTLLYIILPYLIARGILS
ncbi:MAG: hypothetical protein AB1772_02925 [Candidatus Zixiibacteriota bacterium]